MNVWAIFLTGLTTGGLSCLAMQGGLLASTIANQKENELNAHSPATRLSRFDQLDWLPVGLFLVAKLVSHTLLGFLLGWIGSQLELSLTVRLIFQGVAAGFMLATAANLLNLHPVFRYVVFQPPRFLQRIVKNSSKSTALFTPAVLGFMTIFIPCGVTQAMEVLAITSGSPFAGAVILFAFVLGTSPLFAVVGVATATLSERFQHHFLRVAAALLIFLGLSSIHGILVALDAPFTLGKVTQPIVSLFSRERGAPANSAPIETVQGVQPVLIQVTSRGYSPNRVQVQAGIPVQLTLQTQNTYTCASSFLLQGFGIQMQLAPTDRQTVSFTPTQKGSYVFSCSMGMYTGVLEVL